MKSIRQKAKAYDEAIERAKYYYNDGKTLEYVDDIASDIASDIFPELKENNDKRIRKEIIDYIKTGANRKDWIAWLENQEQRPATIDIDKMVNNYVNNKERGNEEFGKPVNCMIRAYRQGLNDAIGKLS